MKLLEPKEIKKWQQTAIEATQKRTAAVSAVLKQEEQALNTLRTHKVSEMKKIETELVFIQEKLQASKKILEEELHILEKRKREAEKPLDTFRKVLAARDLEQDTREQEIEASFRRFKDLQDVYLQNIDALYVAREEFEEKKKNTATHLASEEQKILILKDQQIQALDQARKTNKEAELRVLAVEIREEECKRLLASTLAKEDWLVEQQKNLEVEKNHLASQQQSLQTAFVEARKKNLL